MEKSKREFKKRVGQRKNILYVLFVYTNSMYILKNS